MTTDVETDLRREFDAVSLPSGLTFSPDSILRQGSRTIRRNRIIAVGSAAMAVGLIAVGSTLMTRPHDSAAPQPATHAATTGIVRAQAGFSWGQSQVEFNRDPKVQSNVRYSVMAKDGKWHELGRSSAGKPGQKPDATWKSGIVDGHPVTIGLVPVSTPATPTIRFADGGTYAVGAEELKGTGYTMFYVQYSDDATHKEPARPAEIASIRWSDPTGIIDGIEGDHRLTGRVLALSPALSVDVVAAPTSGGWFMVSGTARFVEGAAGYGYDLGIATNGQSGPIQPSGAAVVTGRAPILVYVKGHKEGTPGPPLAAGILPPGSSGIGAILTTGATVVPLVVSERLPWGGVIFAIEAQIAKDSEARKASIKAVTWTNADGTKGRIDLTQKSTAPAPGPTAMATGTATASTSTAPTAGLPGAPPCQADPPGSTQSGIRPTLIFIGCATSADNLQHISWSSWTTTGATGTATHGMNDCKPNCAQGTFTRFPVNVQLSNPGRVNGMLVFKTIVMAPTSTVGRPETVTADGLYGRWGWAPS